MMFTFIAQTLLYAAISTNIFTFKTQKLSKAAISINIFTFMTQKFLYGGHTNNTCKFFRTYYLNRETDGQTDR